MTLILCFWQSYVWGAMILDTCSIKKLLNRTVWRVKFSSDVVTKKKQLDLERHPKWNHSNHGWFCFEKHRVRLQSEKAFFHFHRRNNGLQLQEQAKYMFKTRWYQKFECSWKFRSVFETETRRRRQSQNSLKMLFTAWDFTWMIVEGKETIKPLAWEVACLGTKTNDIWISQRNFVHCFCHSLTLAVQDCSNEMLLMRNALDTI